MPAVGFAASYTPVQMRYVYGFSALPNTVTGAGETIGIIDFGNDPYVRNDLTQFDSEYGFAAPPSFTIENETGGSTLPAKGGASALEETELDVEFAHSIAPGANIVLIEAPKINVVTQDDLNTAEATAAGQASVVSMSWGSPGGLGSSAQESAADAYFNHTGVTFVASSGDAGVWNYPASSPYVIGVGGTSISIYSNGTYSGETVWNNSTGSGGGGIDPYEPIPSYQVGVASGPNRNVPDVAYDADPNTGEDFVFEGVDIPNVGGTSIGAPQWSGLIALADQLLVSQQKPTLSSQQALTLMYGAYSNPGLYAQLFHDVTTGDNTNGDSAGPGYDDATGLGSPIANNLVDYLAGLPIPGVLTWDGKADGKTWDVNNTQNWSNSTVTNAVYTDGSSVTFDDTNTSGNTITLAAAVAPGSLTVSSNVNNYTFIGTGSIAGATSLVKAGASTLTIATANSYTGGTTINGGTIQLGNGGSVGDLSTGNITDSGALTFDRNDTGLVLNQVISGSGSMNQIGSGYTAITNISLGYTGTINITNGTFSDQGSTNYDHIIVAGGTLAGDAGLRTTNGNSFGMATMTSGTISTTAIEGGVFIPQELLTFNALAISGGTVQYNLSSASNAEPYSTGFNAAGQLAVLGTATFTGLSTITIGTPATGSFLLLQATSLTGTAPAMITPSGFNFTEEFKTNAAYPNGIILLVSAALAGNLTWDGAQDQTTWDASGHANWNNTGNPNSVYGNNNNITFNDTAATGATTVNLVTAVSPASILVNSNVNNYTISGSGFIAGTTGLTKSGLSTLTLATSNFYTGATTINGGTLAIGVAGALPAGGSVANGAALAINANTIAGNISGIGTTSVATGRMLTAANFTQGSLVNNGSTTITGSGTVGGIGGTGKLTVGSTASSNVLTLATNSGGSTVGALAILGSASLDVNNDHLLISYGTNPDPVAAIRQYLVSGYNGGGWNGTGLVSSAAQANPGYGLGYADSADPGNPAGLGTNTIEVMYTLVGDLNLDGGVNGADFAILAGNFNSFVGRWDGGDVNYDGTVSGADFALLAGNFGKLDSGQSIALSAADWKSFDAFAAEEAGFGAAVPEPATGSVLGVGAIALMGRRRRRIKPAVWNVAG